MLKGAKLRLTSHRAIFWEQEEILIVSDLHLGKAGHFRKHGIPVSRNIHLTDLQVLHDLIQEYKPVQVIFLGDLFHSQINREWDDFLDLIASFDFVNFTLVEGNHDILEEYPSSIAVTPLLEIPPFSFTHIKEASSLYNLSGHIHPGVLIRGKGRQSMTLPCFYFSDQHGLLPAFGQFTGIKKIKPKKDDQVYVIVEDTVIELT